MPANSKLVAVGTVATVSGIIYGAWWYNNYMKNKPPTNWVKVGEISELCIYPFKSCKALKPSSFDCTPMGPKLADMRDRTFAVLDDTGKVVTGRVYPRISQIVPKFNGTTITLSSPDSPTEVEFSMTEIKKGTPKKFDIWTVPTEGLDCGDKVARWISKCLLKQESGLRLFYCVNQDKAKGVNPKIVNMSGITKIKLAENDGGFFAESVSYHLASETSAQYLTSRSSGEVITPLNFRPNFIVKGEKLIPFEEDNWEWVKIGDAVFQTLSPTTRCISTTVNPDTGLRSKSMEPLTSMKRYRNLRDSRKRKVMPSPAMGIYLGLRESVKYKVFVGDSVYIPEY